MLGVLFERGSPCSSWRAKRSLSFVFVWSHRMRKQALIDVLEGDSSLPKSPCVSLIVGMRSCSLNPSLREEGHDEGDVCTGGSSGISTSESNASLSPPNTESRSKRAWSFS